MKVHHFVALLFLALAAGCGGGGGDSNNSQTPSQAFVAGVQAAAATEADEIEPTDISASKEADDDDGEAVVLQ